MSRSGYSDDGGGLELGRWRGQVSSAIRGERGQAFLSDLVASLDELPEKKLIAEDLIRGGEVCAIGSVGKKRGIDMTGIDPEDHSTLAQRFNIASQLVQEVEYLNDEEYQRATPEERWQRMRAWAVENLRAAQPEKKR